MSGGAMRAAGRLAAMAAMAERAAARWRGDIADAAARAGVETVAVEGEAVRLSGRGLKRRWLRDLTLREAGRGRR